MVEKRVAVTLPGGPKVSDTIARAQWAEAEGYSDAWLADGGAPDAMTLAAILGDHRNACGSVLHHSGLHPGPLGPCGDRLHRGAAASWALRDGPWVLKQNHDDRVERHSSGKAPHPGERNCAPGEIDARWRKGDFAGETLQSRGYRQPP